jgi:hypothetical protein
MYEYDRYYREHRQAVSVKSIGRLWAMNIRSTGTHTVSLRWHNRPTAIVHVYRSGQGTEVAVLGRRIRS